jgi:hypothetical protein
MLVTIAAILTSTVCSAEPVSSADESAIRAVIARQSDAWNRHDMDAYIAASSKGTVDSQWASAWHLLNNYSLVHIAGLVPRVLNARRKGHSGVAEKLSLVASNGRHLKARVDQLERPLPGWRLGTRYERRWPH